MCCYYCLSYEQLPAVCFALPLGFSLACPAYQGFGFSQDPKLRPLSLVSDILHSWPEYYDLKSQLWIPVDPTWENTSGIDYFSSFDLNHITFVIHGKDPEYPLPAGTYKTENSRDVAISATNILPQEKRSLTLEFSRLPKRINDTHSYQAKVSVSNNGNTYIWNDYLSIKTTNLKLNPAVYKIDSLAPYEKKVFTFIFNAQQKNKRTRAKFTISHPAADPISTEFTIIPFYYELAVKTSSIIFISASLIYLFILLRKKRNA